MEGDEGGEVVRERWKEKIVDAYEQMLGRVEFRADNFLSHWPSIRTEPVAALLDLLDLTDMLRNTQRATGIRGHGRHSSKLVES